MVIVFDPPGVLHGPLVKHVGNTKGVEGFLTMLVQTVDYFHTHVLGALTWTFKESQPLGASGIFEMKISGDLFRFSPSPSFLFYHQLSSSLSLTIKLPVPPECESHAIATKSRKRTHQGWHPRFHRQFGRTVGPYPSYPQQSTSVPIATSRSQHHPKSNLTSHISAQKKNIKPDHHQFLIFANDTDYSVSEPSSLDNWLMPFRSLRLTTTTLTISATQEFNLRLL